MPGLAHEFALSESTLLQQYEAAHGAFTYSVRAGSPARISPPPAGKPRVTLHRVGGCESGLRRCPLLLQKFQASVWEIALGADGRVR